MKLQTLKPALVGAGLVLDHTELTPAEVGVVINVGLNDGVIPFVYKKSDGSLREAVGTRNPNLIPTVPERVNAMEQLLVGVQEARAIYDESGDISEWNTAIDAVSKFLTPTEKKAYTQNEEWVNYYDFNAKGWRKFKAENLVAILIQK